MKKKKIGIITIHTDFNYGAVLQAIATQKILEFNGYDAEIIDYENPVISQQSRLCYKQNGKVIGYFVTFIRNTVFGRFFYYKKAIKNLNRYLKKSDGKYQTSNELDEVLYDVLVAGSDQIWNPLISRGLDPVFMLDFCKGVKKVSIASSMGSYKLTSDDKSVFKELLKNFDFISVREEHAKMQLQDLTEKKIKVLLDPTLLLNKSMWWDFIAKDSRYLDKKQHYILTYFVGGDKNKYRDKVQEYSDALKLPVWTLQYSNYTWKESDKKILGASINDFVALIGNADLVLTDSFHGVAFSVNFGVEFVPLTNIENPVRVREFLSELEIEDRIDMKPQDFKNINYEYIEKKLDIMRKDSIKWIIDAIN